MKVSHIYLSKPYVRLDLDEQTKIQWEYRTKAIVQRWVNFNYPN